jgi:hypothetical protein
MLLKMSKKSRDALREVLTNQSIMAGKEAVLKNPRVLVNMLDDLDELEARVKELEKELEILKGGNLL